VTPEQAMAQAQAALANQQAAVTPAASQTAVAVSSASQAPSMSALLQQGFAVDSFIKVTDGGLLLHKEANAKTAVDKVRVAIDMSEGFGFKPLYTLSFGNPVQYVESFDGVTTTKGESWTQAVANARAVDPKASPYQTVKVGMRMLEDSQSLKEGTTLGLTFTRTGIANWIKLYQEVVRAGLDGREVEVILGYKVGKKAGYRDWGIPTFELVGEYFEGGGE
jgi:hypothetical protein